MEHEPDCLRCPHDPARLGTLRREPGKYVCDPCGTTFPVRGGIPVLIPDEADLPEGIEKPGFLPCVKASRAARRA